MILLEKNVYGQRLAMVMAIENSNTTATLVHQIVMLASSAVSPAASCPTPLLLFIADTEPKSLNSLSGNECSIVPVPDDSQLFRVISIGDRVELFSV